MPGGYKRGGLQRPDPRRRGGKDLVYGQVNAGKYLVEKADGSLMDQKAQYFVLRVDADPHARAALREYAYSVEAENAVLAANILEWLDELMPLA